MSHGIYLRSKDRGEHSLSRTQTTAEHMYVVGLQGSHAMVKARLLEIQSPAVQEFASRTAYAKTTLCLSHRPFDRRRLSRRHKR
jgi:hypothetical protein